MALDLGKLFVSIDAETKDFDKKLASTKKEVNTAETNVKKATASMSKLFAGVAVGVIVTKLGEVAKASISLASEAEEVNAKFNTAFKGIEDDATSVAESLATNYGLAQSESEKLLAGTGDLIKGFGATASEALSISTEVQQLSVDLASYNNLQGGASQASEILTKAFLGERDALTSLGIKISEADVQQRLLEKGQKDLTGQALLLAKGQATLELATQQSGDAIGDFARTQDSFANQTRIAAANVKDLQVQLGQGLLPIATSGVGVFNNLVSSITDYLGKVNETATALRALESGTATLAQKRAVVEREYQEQVEELIALRQKADKNRNNAYRSQIIQKEVELQGIRNTIKQIDEQIEKENELKQAEIDAANQRAKEQAERDARESLKNAQYAAEIDNIESIIEASKTDLELIEEQIEAISDLDAKDQESKNKQLEALNILQEQKQALLDEEQAQREADYADRLAKEVELNNQIYEEKKELAEKEKELNKEIVSSIIEGYSTLSTSVSTILSNLNTTKINFLESEAEAEIASLDKQFLGEEAYAAKVEEIEKDLAQKKYEIQLKEYEAERAISLIQIAVNTAQGISKAIAQGGTLGLVTGSIVAAAGAAQSAAVLTLPEPVKPTFATGGVVTGATELIAGEDGGEVLLGMGAKGAPLIEELATRIGQNIANSTGGSNNTFVVNQSNMLNLSNDQGLEDAAEKLYDKLELVKQRRGVE